MQTTRALMVTVLAATISFGVGCAAPVGAETTGETSDALDQLPTHVPVCSAIALTSSAEDTALRAAGCDDFRFQTSVALREYVCPSTVAVASAVAAVDGYESATSRVTCAPALEAGQIYVIIEGSSDICRGGCT